MNYVDTIRDQVQGMWFGLVQHLPNFVIALIVLVVTWVFARFAVKIADKIIGKTDIRPSLQKLVETCVKIVIWLVGLLIAAAVVIPGFTPAGAIAGLGIGAVAIGFAFQDIFENFLAGVLIMLREKMRINDVIEVEGIIGRVENITLRETHIRQLSNELTIIPNSIIFKNPVKILTDEGRARTEVIVGVDYGADLEQSEQVLREAVEGIEGLDMEKGVEVYAIEFGGSSINFKIRFWTGSKPRDGWAARHKAILAIKKALDGAGIGIPFPIVTNMFPETLKVEQVTANKGAAS